MRFEALNYPIVFDTPRRLTEVTAWHGLIPVAFALTALHKPRVFVELGTHRGDSYCAFCQAVDTLGLPTRCYAVDTWEGDRHAGFYGAEVYEELRAYHDPLYGRFSSLLRMTFDDALSRFAAGEIDLLHIDGLHTYEAVKHDFESWLPKMSPQGVVILHDVTVREGDFGVWRLWEEICQRYPTRLFCFSYGLGVAAVGEEALSTGLGAWFAAGEEEWSRIQRFFAALGERWMGLDQIKALHARLEASQKELKTAVAQIAAEHERWRRWSDEKCSEIAELQAALQEREAELGQVKAVLQDKEELEKQHKALQEREAELGRVKAVLQEELSAVLNCWLWRSIGRYLVPVVGSGEVAVAPTPMPLSECGLLDLPAYLWSRSGRTMSGMRRFLTPLTVCGDRVSCRGNVLHGQAGGRLLVRLSGFLKEAKVVLAVVGEKEVQLVLEFGKLEERYWFPHIQRWIRLSPKRPTVLYLQLPEAVAAMALAFPESEQIGLAQIAVIAVSRLEGKLGPWLLPLQRGIALLRSRPWQRLQRAVKRYGWWGAVYVARQKLMMPKDNAALSPDPLPSWGDQDPYAYMAREEGIRLDGRRIAVLASGEGNFFMREIGLTMAQAVEKLGAAVMLGDERDTVDAERYDWIVIVAPHEFCTLGKGIRCFSHLASWPQKLLLVNTEQPQTQWFQTAQRFFPAAYAVLDINYQTAVYLRRIGVKTYFVPIGYTTSVPNEGILDHPVCRYLPQEIRRRMPESYADRPLDLVFVGTASPRRKAFFAKHARFFAGLNTFIYLPEGDVPFASNGSRALDFATLSGLIRRAKIVLNIHRDDHPYLEWQRVVNLGILQQTLVISEHCDFCPALEANQDYLDLPLDLIPTVCVHYLNRLEDAESFAQQAFVRVHRELAMETVLARLFSALEAR